MADDLWVPRMKKNLRPAIISVEKGRIYALDLTDVDGILAVPVDTGYRFIGDVFQEYTEKDGLRVKRWFAGVDLIDVTLGPFTSKPMSVAALVEWHNLRSAQVSETSAPLF